MFCLRSWLPLLFIPTNASPAFIFLFFVCTYFLNRPCVYCSILLLILFFTSCNWSDRCFFDFSHDWFEPRPSSALLPDANLPATADGIGASYHEIQRLYGGMMHEKLYQLYGWREWTGLGVEWLRGLLGRREWMIDCLDVNIRL